MTQKERLVKILALLEERPKLAQEELVALFGISKDTARRDILKLVESELVERYPGGISRPLLKTQIETYSSRLIKHGEPKKRIAQEASLILKPGMVIYLDVSTTVNFLAKALGEEQLMVVTNSLDNVLAASQGEGRRVYLLGGFFEANSRLLAGEVVLHQLTQFNFDWSFIGGAGLTEKGVFYSELGDSQLKQALIENSQKVCLLIDSSKVNQQSPYKLNFRGITQIITDQPLPLEISRAVEAEGIEVWVVKGENNDNNQKY